MNLPRLAATRPVTVAMLTFVVILVGVISLTRLPVDLMPEMNIPVAAVATSYDGAGPSEVETLISRPIEEIVTSAAGVKKVSSTSARGSSVVIAEFDWGTDMDFAMLDLREKVDLIKPLLPADAGTPRVLTFDPSAAPVLQLGLTGSRDVAELKIIAEDIVKNRLERISGVASVRVQGGRDTQVHILADAGLMRAYGISFDHMIDMLRASNLNLPGGRMEIGTQEVTIRTTGELSSINDFARIPIPTSSGSIELRDVAEIKMGESDVDVLSRISGRPGVWLEVMKETGANTVDVSDAVHRALSSLENELGEDMSFVTISDESRYIRGSLNSLSENAILGGLLAMIVLFIFLRNVRTTIIIGTAIPISIAFTFLLIYVWGMTLNMMSLGGLALGIGMLVDNGIVVIENIFRHRLQGKSALDAADEGTMEVGTAIIASTLTTVSVFLPVIFIDGLASQIFKDLSLSVSFSLVASLIVSMTLIPMLAAKMLRNPGKKAVRLPDDSAAATADLTSDQPAEHVSGNIEKDPSHRGMYAVYVTSLKMLLKRRWLLYTGIITVFALSVLLIPRIGVEFMPPFDEGQISVTVEMPKGARLDDTDRIISQIETYAMELPDVSAILATSGSMEAPDSGSVSILLVDVKERVQPTDYYVDLIRSRVSQIPGATITVASSSGLTHGAFGSPIQIEVRGSDLVQIESEANRIAEIIKQVDGTRDVKVSNEDGRPELQIHVDRHKAGHVGLSVAQIAGAVRTAVSGQTATVFRHDGEEIDVVVRLKQTDMNTIEDLNRIPLGTPFGMVPLAEVATLYEAISPISINRTDQTRVVAVTADLSGRDIGSVMGDIKPRIDQLMLPTGVDIEYAGEDEQINEAFGDLGLALILAIFLIYAVLASQFESLLQPFIIIFTVPFAFIGVIWGLFMFGYSLSIVAFIGVIMLVGIAVNNAIVLIDYINQLRARGIDRMTAIIEAGRTRLRPILMTTLTTVLGMLPLLIGMDEGSESMGPLAAVVVCGLMTATILTLTVIPSLYLTFDNLSKKVRRPKSRLAKATTTIKES